MFVAFFGGVTDIVNRGRKGFTTFLFTMSWKKRGHRFIPSSSGGAFTLPYFRNTTQKQPWGGGEGWLTGPIPFIINIMDQSITKMYISITFSKRLKFR